MNVCVAVLAAGIVWSVALLYRRWANHQLEKTLQDAVDPAATGIQLDLHPKKALFELNVRNRTNAHIRIRSIVFFSKPHPIALRPEEKRRLFSDVLEDVLNQRFDRLDLHGPQLEEDGVPASQVLPPKTTAFWVVDDFDYGRHDWKLTHGVIVFEYGTLFGGRRLVQLRIPDKKFELIKSSFERLNTCFINNRPIWPTEGS